MGSKITIIGAGSVGSAIANDIVAMSLATEIVLIDINKQKAFGEATDIFQGTGFSNPSMVRAGDYPDAAGSSMVIITSGLARKPGQSRLELAQANVNILKSITPNIVEHCPDAIYIIVANPVDIMTYAFHKLSGIPENRIIGSGTVLDTARLQVELAKDLDISPKNVHAHVYGEHGDSSFIPWSLANISNTPIEYYISHIPHNDNIAFTGNYEELEHRIRESGAVVIQAKGATCFAVAFSVCHIIKAIQNGAGTSITISTMFKGEYGIEDVCMSVLTIVDENGVRCKVINPLTDDEQRKLEASANKLKETIAGLVF